MHLEAERSHFIAGNQSKIILQMSHFAGILTISMALMQLPRSSKNETVWLRPAFILGESEF